MTARTTSGIISVLAGLTFLLLALFRTSLPPQKRWIFAYTAFCFFVFGGLEYSGIIQWSRGPSSMTAWGWIRIVAGVAGLYETYRQRQKNPKKKMWILWLFISIALILTGAFRI